MDPKGKVALVTGGGRRLGRAMCVALAQAGADIVVNYRSDAESASETASAVEACGARAFTLAADVAEPADVARLVNETLAAFGRVDILVNNASHFERTPFPTDDVSAWRRCIDILVNGPFYCANEVAPHMLRQQCGTIVNILDLSAWEPWPDLAAHSVGKAALLALTRQLALELAPHVRANAIAPSAVLPADRFDAAQVDRLARRNLLGRWGTPEDVAEAVVFLVRSEFITGESIIIDGGEHFGHCRTRFADA